ncbi:ABC transporter substrate-binding protein [Arthrobacter sp. AK01]|uniref:ABC transporter substrate-binding protein n=1 Tax=Micrococcaceae TaxID=1268 RepID=UPI001E2AD08E|nr:MULTISPECIES: ABC transporter substrate-binding protein [Micrococcaceae]MCD4852026.1 ABC transporter substrate-binding protein [Arthrobacter sp. AK01]MCP1413755.1 NitT/TauT family transport system substrate-binding protein [Paenarthrobacter sp. A20]
MNYFAQAEQGGYWDAMQKKAAERDGVMLDVRQGGPGIQTIPQVAAGQADFGIGNADEILLARKNGLPVVAVAAAYDTNLFAMLSHKDLDISSFHDLNGHQVSRRPAPYFDYLKATFALDKIEEINFTGSFADFQRNHGLIQQGFVTGDVFKAKKEGIDINVLSVAKDGGYNPYGLVLFTTEKTVQEKPDFVAAVVRASIQGWENFLKDPSDAKAAVMAANPDADEATFDFSATTIAQGGYLGSKVGAMKPERWNVLRDQLVSVGLIPKDFDSGAAYTTEFLPKD